jgi:lysophospholipase L1-like esterase
VRLPALVAVLAAVAGCLAAGSLVAQGRAQARECIAPGGKLIAYGHSYLRSPELGGAKASYAALAAASLGLDPVIRAVNGGTTLDTEKLVTSGPTRGRPGSAGLVLIDSAINDIGDRLPTATWTAALRRILTTLTADPAPIVLLMRPLRVTHPGHPGRDPQVIEAYAERQREVAAEFETVRIVDASDGWQPGVDLSADGVHPTTAGETHLARALRGAAAGTLCAPAAP